METNFCHLCPDDPDIRRVRGCDGPSQMAAGRFLQEIPGERINDPHWRYRTCPQKFITPTVSDWWERQVFLRDYPHTQVAFDEVSPRHRAFKRYYDKVRGEYRELAIKGNAWLGKPPI